MAATGVRVIVCTMTSPAAPPAHLLRIESPIGRIELGSNGDAIVSLSIEADGRLPFDGVSEQSDGVLERAAAQLAEYFDGARHDFDLPVDLGGTEFQRSVWEQLVELEWGELVTYGELGRGTGRPTAGRAVGGAIGANPVPIIVPCHRVVGSDGSITGYSAGEGIATKRWLLAHEGCDASAKRKSVDAETALFDIEAGAAEIAFGTAPGGESAA
jgi:methylated-DNA-[protein]-cysteine S-methyltransferase